MGKHLLKHKYHKKVQSEILTSRASHSTDQSRIQNKSNTEVASFVQELSVFEQKLFSKHVLVAPFYLFSDTEKT